MNYLILIVVGVVGFALGRRSARSKMFAPRTADELDEIRLEAIDSLTKRKERRKNNILEMIKREDDHQDEMRACNFEEEDIPNQLGADGRKKKGVVCKDVENLLDVSDTTARKYLNELEKEGEIKQIGASGRDVYYTAKGVKKA